MSIPLSRFVRPSSVVVMTLVWLLLWGSVTLTTVVAGALVALVVSLLLPMPAHAVDRHHIKWVRLSVYAFGQLVISSILVGVQALNFRSVPRSMVITRSITTRSQFHLTLVINTMNLIPGSLVTHITLAEHPAELSAHLTIHVLNGRRPRAIAAVDQQIERLLALAGGQPS